MYMDDRESPATSVIMEGIHVEYSGFVNEPGVTGTLIDCGLAVQDCAAPPRAVDGNEEAPMSHHICLIQRGYVLVSLHM